MPLGYSVEDFLSRDIPVKEPLIEDLLHGRDLVTCAGRRRHGKTTFLVNLCVALALPRDDFLDYEIPEPRRSLMLLLEDDSKELQEKLGRIIGEGETEQRIKVVTRDDFLEAEIATDIKNSGFREAVRAAAQDHNPDVIVVDNLAHVVGAKYNEPDLIHLLMSEVYQWAKEYQAAVILAAHPRKEDLGNPVRLDENSEQFFETVMGSSHLVNSTGSLWGLQRRKDEDYAVFVGGRQRGTGQEECTVIQKGEDDWFTVSSDVVLHINSTINTPGRQSAWHLLPAHPQTFRYNEAQTMVSSVMRSSSTFYQWMKKLKQHKLVLEVDEKLQKNPAVPNIVEEGNWSS